MTLHGSKRTSQLSSPGIHSEASPMSSSSMSLKGTSSFLNSDLTCEQQQLDEGGFPIVHSTLRMLTITFNRHDDGPQARLLTCEQYGQYVLEYTTTALSRFFCFTMSTCANGVGTTVLGRCA